MEYILGRDANTTQLDIISEKQTFRLGLPGSVPMTVSRRHCLLTIDDSGRMSIKNLKPQNVTYVNDHAVESKSISPSDTITLGASKYRLNLSEVLATIKKVEPKVVDIRPLRQVWNDYKAESMEMTVAERRFNALRGVTGLVTMIAIVCAMTLGHNPIYFLLYGTAIVLTLAFTIKAYVNSSKVPEQREELTHKLHRNYVCPNCGRYFNMDYDTLTQYNACPYCKAKFRK